MKELVKESGKIQLPLKFRLILEEAPTVGENCRASEESALLSKRKHLSENQPNTKEEARKNEFAFIFKAINDLEK